MIACAIAALCCAADITIQIAPDQPVPHVYVDEPLVIELAASGEAAPDVAVSFSREEEHLGTVDLGIIPMHEGMRRWVPLANAQMPKGIIQAVVSLDDTGESREITRQFCVLERPVAGTHAPVIADIGDADLATLVAMADVPVHLVRADAEMPNLGELMRRCRTAGLSVALRLNTAEPVEDAPEPEGAGETEGDASPVEVEPEVPPLESERLAEELATEHGALVGLWELDGAAGPDAVVRAAAAIRRGGNRAPIVAVVDDPDDVAPLLSSAAGKVLAGFALAAGDDTPDPGAFRTAALESGREGLLFYGAATVPGEEPTVRRVLENLAAHLPETVVPASRAYDGAFKPLYVHLNGLAHRFRDAQFVGPLSVDDGVNGLVFRRGSTWIAALWSDDEDHVSLSVGDASTVRVTDACNNDLPVSLDDGAVEVPLSPEPVFVSGDGGSILLDAAAAMAAQEAEAWLDHAGEEQEAMGAVGAVIEEIADGAAAEIERLQFIALLQGFSDIEAQWRHNDLARESAVPAVAGLARIVRLLCIVEQERGNEFVESLQNVIARSGEFQSVYLMSTGADGAGDARGDWILDEVTRLISEAEALRAAGRPIEAVGVASLAEARARALEHLVPEAAPPPTGTAPIEETEEGTTET